MTCEIQSVQIAKETSIKRVTVKQQQKKNALEKKPNVWPSNLLLILQKDQKIRVFRHTKDSLETLKM